MPDRALTSFEEIGLVLAQARERIGRTQAELAEQTGLSLSTIQRAESGEIIRPPTLAAMCEALKIRIKPVWEPML